MDVRKIVVVVEDVEAARAALKWTLNNLFRYGDLITLLHVFPSTRSRSTKKLRLLRSKGYHLALSFKDICNKFFNTNTEIIVTEGDEEGIKIASMVKEIGASMLVVGLHEQSFLYKLAMVHNDLASNFLSCRVLAVRQQTSERSRGNVIPQVDSSTNMDFSQIEISGLEVPDVPPSKVPYQICPDPHAIIWRSSSKSSKRRSH